MAIIKINKNGAIILEHSQISMFVEDLNVTLEVKMTDSHYELQYIQSWNLSFLTTA